MRKKLVCLGLVISVILSMGSVMASAATNRTGTTKQALTRGEFITMLAEASGEDFKQYKSIDVGAYFSENLA